jgi:hypothetical protein
MQTTFVHIGDTHLRSTHPRNAARLKALDQIIDEGLRLPTLAAWLWPGDIFDARSSIDDRNALADRLLRMAARAPVVICYGNHEAPGDLDVFAKLSTNWPIHLIATPRVLYVALPMGQAAAIAVMPYPHRAGLIAAGAAASNVLQLGQQALEDIFRGLAMELGRATREGALPVFIGHFNIAGSVASTGQPQIGVELEATTGMLAHFADCYRGLNHIHRAQAIGGAHYAGSIAPMDFGEMEGKRYLVIEYGLDDDHWAYHAESRPLDTPRLYHVEASFSRDAGFAWQVTKGPGGEAGAAPDSWAGCEVRVRYKFAASERGLIDDGVIRDTFKDAARLELEPVAIPDRALRAPEVAAAKTLADKLRAWADLNQTVATDSVLQKLAALEHGDATSVLAGVANQVGALENGRGREAA